MHDALGVFILTKVLTKADPLAPVRFRIDMAYQWVMGKLLGYHTSHSASGCFLCVSCWVATAYPHQPGWFLQTYALAYAAHAFLKVYAAIRE